MATDVSALIEFLSTGGAAQQAAAAEKLAQLGEEAQPAALELVAACGKDALREWVTAALEGLGPPAAGDVSRLTALLDDQSADVAYWAATLLGRLGPDATAATQALATSLARSPHPQVRERAALALGKIGPPAAAAAPALEAASKEGAARLATLAREALASVRPS